jgi:hypothetical protein
MIVVVIAVMSAAAAFPRLFQVVAPALGLAAAFTMFADGLLQLIFRIADPLLALSVVVVVAVKRLRGNGATQECENYQRRNQRSDFVEHATSRCGMQSHLTPDSPAGLITGQTKDRPWLAARPMPVSNTARGRM